METANHYLQEVYRPGFSTGFSQSAPEEGSAFVPWIGVNLDDTLCEQYERTVSADNCMRFETLILHCSGLAFHSRSRMSCGALGSQLIDGLCLGLDRTSPGNGNYTHSFCGS